MQCLHKSSPVAITMASKEEEFIVYLSSLGSKDQYPENIPGSFTNEVIPLALTPNREYEVALHGIFIPREVYTLHQDDNEAILEVYTEKYVIHDKGDNRGSTLTDDTTSSTTNNSLIPSKNIPNKETVGVASERQLRYSLKPPRNIASKEIDVIVEELNAYWMAILKAVFGFTNYKTYFNEKHGILSYTRGYVKYHKRALNGCDGINYCKISLLFKPRLAAVLGFIPNQLYDIFVTDEGQQYALQEVNAHFPPDPHADVDYLHLYCDIIQPCRFAGQTVNILATLPYGASENYYSVQRPLYKKLCKNTIDSIAVLVTDQYGRKVYFEERRSATIVLHIRPTPIIY